MSLIDPPAEAPPPDPQISEGPQASERARLHAAAGEFEAIFMQQMVRTMREAQLDDGFFGDRPGAAVYEAMFEEHIAGALAGPSPLGIAGLLEESLDRRPQGAQEAESALRAVAGKAAPEPWRAPLQHGPASIGDPSGGQVPAAGADGTNKGGDGGAGMGLAGRPARRGR